MSGPYFNSMSSKISGRTLYPNSSKGASKTSVKKLYANSLQKSKKNPPGNNYDQPVIIHEVNQSKFVTTRSKSECKCDLSLCGSPYRLCTCGPEVLWVLLLGLALSLTVAAITIPIIVGLTTCAVTYSQNFTSGANSATQCTAWTSFVAGLTCSTYYTVHIYGSKDTTGITLTDSSVATGLATALRTSAVYTGLSNGYTMRVGSCGGGYEITSAGAVCNCYLGYTIRPCIGGSNWGGIYGTACGAVTQTMTISFA